MIIKNYEVEQFGRFLFELKLRGRQSIMRTRFIKLLQAQLDLQAEERKQLIDEFCKKDENGDPLYEENDVGESGIIIEDPQEFNKEVIAILDEDFIIEETQDKLEMLTAVKGIVLDCDLEFSGEEAMSYDRWCEIVEDIK